MNEGTLWQRDAAAPDAANGEPDATTGPRLFGTHVYLRPVTPGDYPFIQMMELGGELGTRWRFRGATPSPDQWTHALWHNVLVQYLVLDRKNDKPVGLVLAYRANFQDGHAYIAAARLGQPRLSPLMLLGSGVFIHYVFTCWNFRKLYFETTEYNYPQFASGAGRLFEIEGRLIGHRFFDGRHWDELILAVTRDAWMERGKRLVELECPPGLRRIRVRMPAGRFTR
jgi:hypothetical protein